MALAIDNASMMPTNAMASAPVDRCGSHSVCTSGICGPGRLRGILAATDTAVRLLVPGTDHPVR